MNLEKESTYRPLPSCLTVKESGIEGLGLFAKEDIPSGTNLGITHIDSIDVQGWIRTPLGGFYNHSITPNCRKELEFVQGNDYYEAYQLITSEDIKAGDELTVEYSLYEIK